MFSSSGKLTEEQKRRIEENRRKALEKRAARQQKPAPSTTATVPSSAKNSNRSNAPSTSSSTFQTVPANYNDVRKTKNPEMDRPGVQFPSRPQTNGGTVPNFYGQSSKTSSACTSNLQRQGRQQSILSFAPSTSNSKPSCKPSLDKYAFAKSDKKSAGKESVVRGGGKAVQASCVLISRDRFTVDVSYQADLIGVFKTIPSRNYNAKTTKWTFALEDYKNFMSAVKSLPPHVSVGGLPKSIVAAFLHSSPGVLKSMPTDQVNLNSIDAKLVGALMPFQKEGVSFSIRHDGRAMIADDMGLGKTVQALCVASYYRKEWPLLIIAPSSLRLTWKQAIIRWLPSVDPHFINVVFTGKDSPTSGLVNIISYDLLSKLAGELKKQQFRVVIADESHFIKNNKATRTKAALPILKGATRVVLLSGTPALSRPCELYTQVSAVQPRLLPSFHEFGLRYCAGVQNRWGWDYSGASNMEELQLLLEEKVLIRRLKKDVLPQLPSKRRQMVMLDPSLVKTRLLQKAAKEVANAKKKEKEGALLHYFSESCEAKIPAIREYISDLLEGGHKFLVFAHHKGMLDAISECLTSKKRQFIRIDGSTPAGARQSLCDAFQKDSTCTVAVLSITAANTGLTLTAATAVVFAELFWNPGALVQAEDRVYRIGQKNSVNVHYLVAKGTADDYLWPLVQEKLEILNKAGLSGDDFSGTDSTTFQDPRQKKLFFSYIESFMEDNEALATLDIDKLTSEAMPQGHAGSSVEGGLGTTNSPSTSVANAEDDVSDDVISDDVSWIDAIGESEPHPSPPAGRATCDQSPCEPRAKRSRKVS